MKVRNVIFIISSSLLLFSCSKELKYARTVLDDTYSMYMSGDKSVQEEQLTYSINYVLQNSNNSEDKALAYFLRANLLTEDKTEASVKWMDDMARGCVEVDKTKNHKLAASIYLDYGIELNKRSWFDLAVPILQKSLEEANKEDMTNHEVFALMNLSRAVLRCSDLQEDKIKALKYASDAVNVAKDHSEMILYAKAMFALSSCYRDLKMYDEALSVAITTAGLMEEQYAQGLREEPVSYYQVANSYLSVGQADSAIVYALKDLDNPGIRERMSANKLLGHIYKKSLNDKSKASEYMEEYRSLQDSINLHLQNEKVLSDRISLAEELVEARKKKTETIILLSVVFCIGICASAFALFRRNARKNKESFNREQDNLKQRLVDSDQLVCDLKNKARYLDDKDWDRIIAIVNDTYQDYCTVLSSRGLTKNNIRLACAVRLGFSTSECADMLGISPSSVTKAKQRLKSKLI